MFEKSLQDLVKGIRSHKRDPSAFISQAIQEIKQELRSTDVFVKSQAVRKLTFLQMMGYDMSWASFSVVEVMSSSRFAHKRIGYLAACQTFTDTTDVILLTTNLLKKEFQSPNQYEAGLAINCLANIVTTDLARDLIGDVVLLITHTKPYVRKKAVLSMYKLFVKYPQGLRLTFDKLKERLEDSESAVVSCAVNVICELANKNPKNYLAMAPKFFRLLTTSSNNWMLIKVVKLLGSLVPEEPRLARKLLEPLATIIQNTAAKSLLYECIHTVTLALPFARKPDGSDAKNLQAVVTLCSEHLRQFVEDPDQNLKYLGLVGFVNLMKSFPKSVMDHKELVLHCLSDDDVTIRMKALELLTGMVTKRNLTELVHKLMQHVLLAEGRYRDEIIDKILFMCSRDKYAYLTDLPWYVSVLVDLSYVQGPFHGPKVAAQLIDVSVRAESVRAYAVKCMLGLLLDANLFLGQSQTTISNVLYAAGWLVGEYAEYLDSSDGGHRGDHDGEDEEEGDHHASEGDIYFRVLQAYLDPKVTNLPQDVQVVYMQNALKVFTAACHNVGPDEALERILLLVRDRITLFMQSVHIEVQERATTFRNLLSSLGILVVEVKPSTAPRLETPNDLLLGLGEDSVGSEGVSAARLNKGLLAALCAEALQPVNAKAQRKVPLPEGLDLDKPINSTAYKALVDFTMDGMPKNTETARVCFTNIYLQHDPEEEPMDAIMSKYNTDDFKALGGGGGGTGKNLGPDYSGYQMEHESDRQRWQSTPFYLQSSSTHPPVNPDEVDIDSIPVIRLTEEDLKGKKHRRHRKKGEDGGGGEKGRHGHHHAHRSGSGQAPMMTDELMPEGAKNSGSEDESPRRGGGGRKGGGKEALELKDVDITTPLRPDEVIPQMVHRIVEGGSKESPSAQKASDKAADRKKKKKGGSSSKEHRSSRHDKGGGSRSPTKSKKGKPVEDEALLIDLDDFTGGGGGATAPANTARWRSESHDSQRLRESAMDLLNFDYDEGPPMTTTESPEPSSAPTSATTAPTTNSNSLGLDMMGGLLSEPPQPAARSRSSTSTSQQPSQPSASVSPAPSKDKTPSSGRRKGSSSRNKSSLSSGPTLRHLLAKNKALKAEYSLMEAGSQRRQVTLQFRVKNNSDGPLSDVAIIFQDFPPLVEPVAGAGTLVASSPGGGGKAATFAFSGTVSQGETVKGSVVLTAPDSVERTIVLPTAVRYSTGNLLDGASQATGRVRLYCASFLVPTDISASAFTSLLTSGEVRWHEASTQVETHRSAEACMDYVASFFRCQIVEKAGTAASMYARTGNNQHHVALLAKHLESSGEVSLTIKCTQQTLLQELVADANTVGSL